MFKFLKNTMARIACALPLKLSTIKAAINSVYTKLSECVNGSSRIDKSLAFPMSRFLCYTDMQASQGDPVYVNKDSLTGTVTWAAQLTNNPVGTGPVALSFGLWRGGVKIASYVVNHPEGVFKFAFAKDYAREPENYNLTLKSEAGEGYYLWTDANGNPAQMTWTVQAKVADTVATAPVLQVSAREINTGVAGESTIAFDVYSGSAVETAVSGYVSHTVGTASYAEEAFSILAGATKDEVFQQVYVHKTAAYDVVVTLRDSVDGSYTVGATKTVTVTIPAA